MNGLTNYYLEKAGAFIKTVVCFDDKVEFCKPHLHAGTAVPLSAPDDGFSTPTAITEAPKSPDQKSDDKKDDDFSNELDARALTEAFADKGILCSVIVPHTAPDEIKKQIVTLTKVADITILDWKLAVNDSTIARDAIVDILTSDIACGGRLRLIILYSDATAKDVMDELHEKLATKGFRLNEATLELRGSHPLIVFFQKPESVKSLARAGPCNELPTRAVEEFSKLTAGLLPAAALAAITEIREKTHHLLATFPSSLDGAFLAHRCLIPDPNDAEQFALDLIAGEIGTLLSHSTVNEAVNAEHCEAWVNEIGKFNESERKRLSKALTKYSQSKTDGLRKLFQEVKLSDEVVASKVADLILETCDDSPPEKIELRNEYAANIKSKAALFGKILESDSMSDRDTAEKVIGLLYRSNSGDMARAKDDISMISTIDTSIKNITIITKSLPRLRLGSLVKDSGSGQYMLCIQPLCDSVRIKHNRDTIFPFLKLNIQSRDNLDSILDLCIPTKDGDATWLSVAPTPNNLISILFRAKSSSEAFVEAIKSGDGFIFRTSDQNKTLEWVADLKIGKAQRIVSQLAARIHTLGIDEFEWMRLHQSKA
jgi:hypothetical protein